MELRKKRSFFLRVIAFLYLNQEVGEMDYILIKENNFLFQGNVHHLIETLEFLVEKHFEFRPLLQENEDEGYLEIYLHTDSYEILTREQIEKLNNAGITEVDSLKEICNLLNITIRPLHIEEGKKVMNLWDIHLATEMYM